MFIQFYGHCNAVWLLVWPAAAAAKSLQSCPTLCDPIDGSPPGSSVPGILQARTLEWVAISFSNAGKWKVKVKSLSHVRLFATPWTVAHHAPPSMGFSRQEHWSQKSFGKIAPELFKSLCPFLMTHTSLLRAFGVFFSAKLGTETLVVAHKSLCLMPRVQLP